MQIPYFVRRGFTRFLTLPIVFFYEFLQEQHFSMASKGPHYSPKPLPLPNIASYSSPDCCTCAASARESHHSLMGFLARDSRCKSLLETQQKLRPRAAPSAIATRRRNIQSTQSPRNHILHKSRLICLVSRKVMNDQAAIPTIHIRN